MPPPDVPALVDHHCHSVLTAELADEDLAGLLTESDRPPAPGTSPFDSALGLAVRRWCPPALGLPAHAPAEEYLARRRELGAPEATRRLLAAAGLETCLVDTGLTAAAGRSLLPLDAFAEAAGVRVREVVRLERIAEAVAGPAGGWARAVREALAAAASGAVAVKSVLAYRTGLAVPAERPGPAEVAAAAGEWLRAGGGRLTDRVLLHHLLWTAVDVCADLGLPLQLHTGFGDPDLTLHRADPSLLAGFVRAAEPTGVPLVLLHGYPYHRQAAWLAHVFPLVHTDLGLTASYVGPRVATVLGEMLELAPFGKLLFSTDAYGLPELYLVGAAQFRHGLGTLLDGWRADGACTAADAERLTRRVAAGNARRLYAL
ncbi:amidohydrolase family protein [Streptomyces sp. BE20]|uniref:amidohydrolase family protein n=1 Tax=Streptomyces sp. BE20 TaxID=3002525 RepID=UPI002E7A68AB|nr:amidohydrolase family protein [Streptomyces sp. BE20]MEE1827226.1 amidohydrolase family protein [Streptomyces sp. BE20]